MTTGWRAMSWRVHAWWRGAADAGLLPWLFAGLLIRLSVMPFTMHADFIFIQYFPSLFAYHGVVDIYSYLRANYAAAIFGPSGGWFYYPPLTYYTLGAIQLLCRPLMPLFEPWMADLGRIMTTTPSALEPYLARVDTPHLMRHLFLLKLPYLVADMATGGLLLGLVAHERERLMVFRAWMLNPVTVYSSFMAGRFEVLPTFCLVASLSAARRLQRGRSALWLGVAAAFNNIPALGIPALCAALAGTWAQRVRLALVSLAPYLVLFVPLYISSRGFVQHVVLPPLRRGQVQSFAEAPAFASTLLFLIGAAAFVVWVLALRGQVSPRTRLLVLLLVLGGYLVYAARLGLSVPFFLLMFGVVVTQAAVVRDAELGIQAGALLCLFDFGLRFHLHALILAFIYLLIGVHAWRVKADDGRHLATYYLIVLASAFSLVTISFFWFVLVTPLLVLWAAHRPWIWPAVAAQVAGLALVTLYHRAVLGMILTPLHPAFFASLPDLTTLSGPATFGTLQHAGHVAFRWSSWLIVAASLRGLYEGIPQPDDGKARGARAFNTTGAAPGA